MLVLALTLVGPGLLGHWFILPSHVWLVDSTFTFLVDTALGHLTLVFAHAVFVIIGLLGLVALCALILIAGGTAIGVVIVVCFGALSF